MWANSKNLLKLEVQNEQLNDLASRDTLTGVYLISAFKEKAQQILDTRPEKFAVVYTDFSDFKYINDVFGYDYGDLLLSQYGKILQKGLHEYELCGRVSADNFVLLLHYSEKARLRPARLPRIMKFSASCIRPMTARCCPQTAVSAA